MMDPLLLYLLIPAAALGVFGIALKLYVRHKVGKLPDNRPDRYRDQPAGGRRLVVCLGDSLTQGTISYNYVDQLNENAAGRNFEFVNAGVNSDLAWNVLQRLDEIIALQPAYITILVGTNDAAAVLTPRNKKSYMKRKKLPQEPDSVWFRESMRHIITRLKKETRAVIALMSPPLIGEDIEDESNVKTAEYSSILKKLAEEYNLSYLPLNERERELLQSLEKNGRYPYRGGGRRIRRSAFQYYVKKKSWDRIAEENGLLLSHDQMHKNSKGGKIIVHLIERFLTQEANGKQTEAQEARK